MPLLLEKSLQAQILIPLAASLAFGLMAATVIALFLVPSIYCILDDFDLGEIDARESAIENAGSGPKTPDCSDLPSREPAPDPRRESAVAARLTPAGVRH